MSFSATASTASKGGGDGKGKQDGGERKADGTGPSLLTLPDELLLAILEQVNLEAPFSRKHGLAEMAVNKRFYRLARAVCFSRIGNDWGGPPVGSDFLPALLDHPDVQPLIQDLLYDCDSKDFHKYDFAILRRLCNLHRLRLKVASKDDFTFEDAAWSLAQAFPQLQNLELSHTLPCRGTQQLIGALPSTLSTLKIDMQGLDNTIYYSIPWTTLKDLKLCESVGLPINGHYLVDSLRRALYPDHGGRRSIPLRRLELGNDLLSPAGSEEPHTGKLNHKRFAELLGLLVHVRLDRLVLQTGDSFEWPERPPAKLDAACLTLTASCISSMIDSPRKHADLCLFLALFPHLRLLHLDSVYFADSDELQASPSGDDPLLNLAIAFPTLFGLLNYLRIGTAVLQVTWCPPEEDVKLEWVRGSVDEDFVLERKR